MHKPLLQFLAVVIILFTFPRPVTIGMTTKLTRFDFEIFGNVQGVFFRKFTVEEAQKLGVRGWCKNTPRGTVQGQAEGPEDKMKLMKYWLQNTGSPMSTIEKSTFDNEGPIDAYTFDNFTVIKKK